MAKFALAAIVVTALVWSGNAAAKEISKVQLCGVSGCESMTDRSQTSAIAAGGSDNAAPPPALGAYYRLSFTVTAPPGASFSDGHRSATWSEYYVPDSKVLRQTGDGMAQWFYLSPKAAGLLGTLAKSVKPFPKPKLSQVLIGTRRAKDPQSYGRLLGVRTAGLAVPGKSDWLTVTLRSSRPSPWTDGQNVLQYSPSARVLQRDAEFVRLPDGLAARVAAGRSLDLAGKGFPWVLLTTCLLGVAAAVALARLASKRRPVPRRQPTTA